MATPMKVLIVDDEQALLDMYKEKLVFEGFTVITAMDGAVGLKKAQEEAPDVVLLDLIMPTMNGLDVLKALRSDPKTKELPVFLLTNIPESASGGKGAELGASGYLFKAETEPNKLAAVLKLVKRQKPKKS